MFQLNLSQICLKILTTSHSSVEIVGNKCAVDGVRFQGEQNMTIRRAILQRNESRTSCSPYNTNYWLPCIRGKKPCIIGKTKRT